MWYLPDEHFDLGFAQIGGKGGVEHSKRREGLTFSLTIDPRALSESDARDYIPREEI